MKENGFLKQVDVYVSSPFLHSIDADDPLTLLAKQAYPRLLPNGDTPTSIRQVLSFSSSVQCDATQHPSHQTT